LSIIIPSYNEEKTIVEILRKIFALSLSFDYEVIVIDDGSVDLTAQAVKESGLAVTLIRQDKNQGKGSAIIKGIQCALGEFILIQDADLEYDPNDYYGLMQPIISGEVKVVYGSRILNPRNCYSYRHFYWGGRLISCWTNFLYGSKITDEPTCYKVFEAGLLRSLKLKCRRFEFCPEVTAKLLKLGIRIKEVPINYSPRSIEEGKKITWKDGVMALWVLLALRFIKG
jgi:dolichol-phosphate mannosyltransferase